MPVRVLVVDDSATMRQVIATRLRADPDILVVGFASNPNEARRAVKDLDPDVMTLDIEMPEMNGLEFLEKIMRLRPMPVVMVSTLTASGAGATTEALALGAFDCVGKLCSDGAWGLHSLAAKVKAAALAKTTIRKRRNEVAPANSKSALTLMPGYRSNGALVAIGASTGGVETLTEILSSLPKACPPIVIVQHMPGCFTQRFANRLDGLCAPRVVEASDGEAIEIGKIIIAPGGLGHTVVASDGRNMCRITDDAPAGGFRPSVDILFHSVARTYGKRAVGVILTGMGQDGAAGLLAMRRAGAHTIGQDQESSVVYGMPRVAQEIGAVERQLRSDKIAETLLKTTDSHALV